MCDMEGWKEITLDNACLIKKGVQFNKTELEDSGSYPCINGGLQPSGYSEKWNTEADTITISEGGESCGYVNRISSRFWCGGHCYSLLQINEKINKDFFYFALKCRENSIMDLRVGSGLPNIQQKALKAFDFIYPISDIEQKKIAQILTALDDTIKQTEQLIAKYKNIKQGLMHDLLAYGIDENGTIRNPQTHTFVEKKGLMVPEEWEVEEIGSNGSVTKLAGFEYTKYFDYNVTGEIIAIRGLNLKNGKLDLKEIQTIPEQVSKSLLRSKLYVNDIVISYVGTVGEIAVIDENDKYHLAPNVAKISFANTNYCAHFIKAFLMSEEGKKAIKFETNSTTQPALSMGNIRKINIPKPMINEQVKIVSILEQQDNLIESEQTNLAKLQNMKQGLMADLLTGKVRVELKEIHNYV